MDAGAEGSSGAEWLHGHLRRYGDVYVNQGEELAIRLFELEAIPFHFFFIFFRRGELNYTSVRVYMLYTSTHV